MRGPISMRSRNLAVVLARIAGARRDMSLAPAMVVSRGIGHGMTAVVWS